MNEQVISYVEGEKGLVEVIIGIKKKSRKKSEKKPNRHKKKVHKRKLIAKAKK